MATNSYPFDERGAFCIDEDGLRNIVKSSSKFTGNDCTINVTFDDQFSHENKDIDALLKHPHFRTNKAQSLTVRSSSTWESEFKSNIRFNATTFVGQGRVNVEISSETDDLHTIRADIAREIRSFRARYDVLYRIASWFWAAATFVTALAFAILIIDPKLRGIAQQNPKIDTSIIPGVSSFVSFSIFFFALWALNRIKLIFCPRFTLAVGLAKDDFAKKADVRKWAFRAALLAAVTYVIKEYVFRQ